ncbi:MAG: PH domain-containing protein [Nanoarchaeota archaeon]|nr:PH domain-containing protein [Nanoarchaeota archaeon]
MSNIRNYQNQEQYQSIKPVIKIPLLIISSFLTNFFLWMFIAVFGAFIFKGLITNFKGLYVFFILYLITSLVSIFFSYVNFKKTEYKFYKDKVEYYEGFLVKNRKTINYNKISNIGQRKGIFERMFGLGTIFIDTAGSSSTGHELSMSYLENPDKVYDWISKVASKAK